MKFEEKKMVSELVLHVPSLEELWYRQQILSDPETMSYNRGYQLNFKGYHNDTGCIDFPKDRWEPWYHAFVKGRPNRFYAYISSSEKNTFLGEVNAHKSEHGDWYDMGVVIESKFRGNGYSVEAIQLLIKEVFETLPAKAIHNEFEKERVAAIKAHLSAGFKILSEIDGIVCLCISKEQYCRKVERKETGMG